MSKKYPALVFAMPYIIMAVAVLLYRNTVSESIQNSVHRCIYQLLPSIFPMMVLSRQIAQYTDIKKVLIPGIPAQLTGIFFIGLLCGYPVPAVICAQKYKNGDISKMQAQYLCAISNGASPAFLILCAGSTIYGSTFAGILLYLSQVLSVILTALLFPCKDMSVKPCTFTQKTSVTESIKSSVKIFAQMCGFVLFFSLAADLTNTVLSGIGANAGMSALISGIFEITYAVSSYGCFDYPFKELLLCLICSTGGISVIFQIKSALSDTDVGIGTYLRFRTFSGIIMGIIFIFLMKIFNI